MLDLTRCQIMRITSPTGLVVVQKQHWNLQKFPNASLSQMFIVKSEFFNLLTYSFVGNVHQLFLKNHFSQDSSIVEWKKYKLFYPAQHVFTCIL